MGNGQGSRSNPVPRRGSTDGRQVVDIFILFFRLDSARHVNQARVHYVSSFRGTTGRIHAKSFRRAIPSECLVRYFIISAPNPWPRSAAGVRVARAVEPSVAIGRYSKTVDTARDVSSLCSKGSTRHRLARIPVAAVPWNRR